MAGMIEGQQYFEDFPELKLPKDMLDLASHIVSNKSGHFDPYQAASSCATTAARRLPMSILRRSQAVDHGQAAHARRVSGRSLG
jgi:non-homologous end joining protein Ku